MKSSAKLLSLVIVAALLVSLMSFASFAADTNLTVNGDASYDLSTGWSTWSNSESTVISVASKAGPDGSDCFYIKNTEAAATTMFQAGVFESGHTYIITADVKGSATGNICLGANIKDSDGIVFMEARSAEVGNTDGWITLSFSVTIPDTADTRWSDFGCRIWGGVGEAYFDNIRCYDMSSGTVAADLLTCEIAGDIWSAVDGKWGGPEQAGSPTDGPQVVHMYQNGMLHVYSTRTDNGLSFSGNVIGIASFIKPNTVYKVEASIKYTANPNSQPFCIRSSNNVLGNKPVIVSASDDFVSYTYTFKTGSTISETDHLMVGIWEEVEGKIYGQMHFGTDIWIKSCVLTDLTAVEDPEPEETDSQFVPPPSVIVHMNSPFLRMMSQTSTLLRMMYGEQPPLENIDEPK